MIDAALAVSIAALSLVELGLVVLLLREKPTPPDDPWREFDRTPTLSPLVTRRPAETSR